MAIRNSTARRLMYEWHGGMHSPFYAAASSGLVASFVALTDECMRIDEPDRGALMTWIQRAQQAAKPVTATDGRTYSALPWANRDAITEYYEDRNDSGQAVTTAHR